MAPESCWKATKVNNLSFPEWLDKTTLPFSDWLCRNITEERKTKNIHWNGRTVTLEEKRDGFHMSVRIDNVDQGLVVINFEQMGRATTYLRGNKGFGDRCDFLVLEETDDEYIAYLIELENTVPERHPTSQLRWSAPYLKYNLEVFLEHSSIVSSEKELNMNIFMIGNRYPNWLNRSGMRRKPIQKFERLDVSSRLDMYCSIYAAYGFDFSDFREVNAP